MKAIKISEPWNVACVEMEKPVPKENEALIRIVTAGICGSDIGAFRGTNGIVSYPRVIGHELAGVVESIPTDVITKKEIDIRGARTSAGEFEEALELIGSRRVDMNKILTKVISLEETPDTIIDIEKNPGNYMKVVVRVSND